MAEKNKRKSGLIKILDWNTEQQRKGKERNERKFRALAENSEQKDMQKGEKEEHNWKGKCSRQKGSKTGMRCAENQEKRCEVGGQHRGAETAHGSSVRLLTHPALRNMLFLSLVPHLRVATGKTSVSQTLLREKQDPNSFSLVPRNANGRGGGLSEMTVTLPIRYTRTSVTSFFPHYKAISAWNHPQPLLDTLDCVSTAFFWAC